MEYPEPTENFSAKLPMTGDDKPQLGSYRGTMILLGILDEQFVNIYPEEERIGVSERKLRQTGREFFETIDRALEEHGGIHPDKFRELRVGFGNSEIALWENVRNTHRALIDLGYTVIDLDR